MKQKRDDEIGGQWRCRRTSPTVVVLVSSTGGGEVAKLGPAGDLAIKSTMEIGDLE